MEKYFSQITLLKTRLFFIIFVLSTDDYYNFKGERLSSVEVHGGATLEETLVPVIVFPQNEKGIHFGKNNLRRLAQLQRALIKKTFGSGNCISAKRKRHPFWKK